MSAFFQLIGDAIGLVLGRLLGWVLPRRRARPGPVERRELPIGTTESVAAALEHAQDPAAALPAGWHGYTRGLARQGDDAVVARTSIGTELQLAIEPNERRDRDEVRVVAGGSTLGYLPDDEDFVRTVERRRVRCWLAECRPSARHPAGAAILFVAIYDPT